MSRIGRLPIIISKNININIKDNTIFIKGPICELIQKIPKEFNITLIENQLTLNKIKNTKIANQQHGLLRSLIKNNVLGVEKKFEKKLQMIGVGYKAQIQGDKLILRVGLSYPIVLKIPNEIDIIIEDNINLTIKGCSKEIVGLIASKIRAIEPPEPYNGKGIHYFNEIIVRKAGKTGKKFKAI